MPGITVVSFNFQGLLAVITGDTKPKGWHEESGPASGCGIDYWYHHKKYGLVYINVDQGYVKISQCRTDEVFYEGMLAESKDYGEFVTHG